MLWDEKSLYGNITLVMGSHKECQGKSKVILLKSYKHSAYALADEKKDVLSFNPIPTRLCHVIYCHSDKRNSCHNHLLMQSKAYFEGFEHCSKDRKVYFWTQAQKLVL